MNIFIKQAHLPFVMLLKVLRTWKKHIKVHLEQKKMCQKNAINLSQVNYGQNAINRD